MFISLVHWYICCVDFNKNYYIRLFYWCHCNVMIMNYFKSLTLKSYYKNIYHNTHTQTASICQQSKVKDAKKIIWKHKTTK